MQNSVSVKTAVIDGKEIKFAVEEQSYNYLNLYLMVGKKLVLLEERLYTPSFEGRSKEELNSYLKLIYKKYERRYINRSIITKVNCPKPYK